MGKNVYEMNPIDRVAKRVAGGAAYGCDLDREKERAKCLKRIEILDEQARSMKDRRYQLGNESRRRSTNGEDTSEIEKVRQEIREQLNEINHEREVACKWLRLNGQKTSKKLDWDRTLALICEKLIEIEVERKLDVVIGAIKKE